MVPTPPRPPSNTQTTTASASLFRTAAQHGRVDCCFANPGTTEMHLVSALDKLANEGENHKIRAVLGLHENVCTGAADGFARMARRPAAVLLHLGPGLSNGLANLHNARRARSPMVVIVGQMSGSHTDTDPTWDPVLHTDIPALARTVSHMVLCPKLLASPPTASHSPLPAHRPASSPSPTELSTMSSASGAGDSSVSCTVKPIGEWLQSTSEVWDVLRGSPAAAAGAVTAAGAAAADSKSEGSSNNGFVVVKNSSSSSSSTEPRVEVCVHHGTASGSRIISLIVPHDLSWQTLKHLPPSQPSPAPNASGADLLGSNPSAAAFVRACAAALHAAPRGKAALFIGGEALLEEGGALHSAGLVAAATGAALLCGTSFARLDRGTGLPCPARLPYFPQEAIAELNKFELLVVVDVPTPSAQFGYKDVPSQLVQLPPEAIWELDTQAWGSGSAAVMLQLLSSELGAAQRVQPGLNCGGLFCLLSRPSVPPPGVRLSPPVLCTVVACMQPPDAIIVDESLTSGGSYWNASKGAPRFSHLTLTGGAIGCGPPLSLGAAIACPSRQVINLQADGSALYGIQALWSQAREQAKVLTVICANSSYAILKVECMRQRLPSAGPATKALTDLGQPKLDWVSLAQGMGVPAVKATTVGELQAGMERGLQTVGPFLIHAEL